MRVKIQNFVLVICCIAALCSCSSKDTPKDVVDKAYTSLQEKDFQKLASILWTDSIELTSEDADAFVAAMNELPQDPNLIKSYEVISIPEETKTDGQFSVKVVFTDGISHTQTGLMRKDAADQWSIDVLSENHDSIAEGNAVFENVRYALIKTLAVKGIPKYQYQMSNLYLDKEYPKCDTVQSVRMLKAAADANYATAQAEYGEALLNGENGVKEDKAEGLKYIQKSADQGNPKGLAVLGRCYIDGNGVEMDRTKGFGLCQTAAQYGEADAEFLLGWCYDTGNGVAQKDSQKAIEYYELAAKHGSRSAYRNLGLMYDFGKGVPKDYKKASQYYLQAAEREDVDAQVNIGYMYSKGLGVEKDKTKAYEWYKKAAAQGDLTAIHNMQLLEKYL